MALARFALLWLALAASLIVVPMLAVHRLCDAGFCN